MKCHSARRGQDLSARCYAASALVAASALLAHSHSLRWGPRCSSVCVSRREESAIAVVLWQTCEDER